MNEQLPVLVIAVVHVKGYDAEAGPDQHRVEGATTDSVGDASRQPAPPLRVQLVI